MRKKQKNKQKNAYRKYALIWAIQYTLLEKHILEVIKKSPDGGCSDDEIAEVLALTPEEVGYVIADELLRLFVQGDATRRTIADGFIGLEWNIVGISKAGKVRYTFPENELLSNEQREEFDDSSRYIRREYNQVSEQLSKLKAKEYYLIIPNNDGEDES